MTRAIVFSVLVAALGGVVALELVGMPGSDAVAAPLAIRPSAPIAARAHPAESWPDRTGVILERPLLSPTRRPYAKAKPGSANVLNALPRISGIVVMPDRKSVIFAAVGEGRPTVAGEGGRLGAFLIQSIEPGEVTVSGPDGLLVLRPSFKSTAPVALANR